MDFYTTAPGEARAELSVPAHYEGYPGVVHGGIIAAMLDETGGRAWMDDPTRFMVTAQLNVRYRKPVPTETPLTIIGKTGSSRGRVSEAHCEIHDPDGNVLAEAELVLVDIPEEQLSAVSPEEMGWQVYTDEEEK